MMRIDTVIVWRQADTPLSYIAMVLVATLNLQSEI
jgi:hypothetical protein